jgi:hypothetical protein
MISALQGYEQEPLVSFKESLQPLTSIVPGIKQMGDMVIEKINQLADDLAIDEPASIMLYTLKWKTPESSFYFFLNKTLRSQNREELLPWFPYIRLFIGALSKLPSISSHTVYCGLRINVNEEYSKGNVLIWRDFVSCTLSIEHADDFIDDNEPRAIFIIECDSAKDISEHLFDENSKEIILYPERQFEIISLLDYGNRSKFIQLKEIRQNFPLIHIPQINSNRKYRMYRLESTLDQYASNTKIDLIDHQMTDADMDVIVQHAIVNKKCQQLLLSKNRITSNGSSILAKALDHNTTLKFLSLAYNDLSDKGVQDLAKILARNNSKLETLSLHETGITDQSVRHLANMLKKNTTLIRLYLGRNKISNQSMHFLTDALTHHNQTLKILDLSQNELITDLSMDYLTEMLESNISLETLWINNCGISVGNKKKLKEVVQSLRRFFLLFVDDIPADVLEMSKNLMTNRGQSPILLRLVR